MSHESEGSLTPPSKEDIEEFERVRNEVFSAQFGISYKDAKEIASWTGGELQAYWKGALEYFENLIKGGE